MLTRFTACIAALAVTLTLSFSPTAHAAPRDPLPVLTAEQWAGLPALVHWYEITAGWTLAQWYWWGIHIAASPHRADWERVARCETGGNWTAKGSHYSGGLGFYNGTWIAYGGRDFAPNAGDATEDQQILLAERIQDPTRLDIGRCHGW